MIRVEHRAEIRRLRLAEEVPIRVIARTLGVSRNAVRRALACDLAMLAETLIEREIRTSMKAKGLAGIPLYPKLRNCPTPSAPRILEIFDDIQRHQLISQDQIVQTFTSELAPLQQQQVLDLLHIPASVQT